MVALARHDDVFVLTLGDDENRFDATSVAHITECWDEVEAADGPRALVTTGEGKFFSNGLDLEWMGGPECDDTAEFIASMVAMLGRVLGSAVPSVAAVNGHAFAGGAMLALAHDRLLMREDRGFWCVNEVLLGMQFAPGMMELLRARLPQPTFHRALTSAERFAGPDAVAAGIAQATASADELVGRAVEVAAGLAPTAGPTLAGIKAHMYGPALAELSAGRLPA